jgi:2-phosphosulfolactate phosphatase
MATDFRQISSHLRKYKTAAKFFDPEKTWAPERDFDLCLDLNRFNFVLVAKADMDGLLYLQKVDIG